MDNDNTLPSPAPREWPMLSSDEARVLGALIEKQLTTPEYYPLTLNTLIAACNQKNNRDPVTALVEADAMQALDGLREKKLAWQVFLAGNRVPKYRHAATDVYHVPDACVPLLAELILRGPQTAAELRSHAARMHAYEDVPAVESLLQEMAGHAEGPFVIRLARETGRREARWAHLLSGPPLPAAAASGLSLAPAEAAPPAPAQPPPRLEADVDELKTRLTSLLERVEALEKRLDGRAL